MMNSRRVKFSDHSNSHHSRDSMMKNGRLRRGSDRDVFGFSDHDRQLDLFERDRHSRHDDRMLFPFHGGMPSIFEDFMRMDPFEGGDRDPFGFPRMGPGLFGNFFEGMHMPSHEEMMTDPNTHYSFQSHSYSRVLQPDGTVVEKKKYKDSTGREEENETVFDPTNRGNFEALDRNPQGVDPSQKALEYNPGNMLKHPRRSKKNDDN